MTEDQFTATAVGILFGLGNWGQQPTVDTTALPAFTPEQSQQLIGQLQQLAVDYLASNNVPIHTAAVKKAS